MAEITRYEVKFVVEPESLFEDAGAPFAALALRPVGLFDGPPDIEEMTIAFVDDAAQALFKAHWSVRVRQRNASGKIKVTFKRRYPDTELSAALQKARGEGFGPGEVDWGLCRSTLSFSLEGRTDGKTDFLEAARNAPPELFLSTQRLAWQSATKIFGPVRARRWSGTNEATGLPLEVEAWMLNGNQLFVDAAFEHPEEDVAAPPDVAVVDELRRRLRRELVRHGVVIADEAFKTTALLKSFS